MQAHGFRSLALVSAVAIAWIAVLFNALPHDQQAALNPGEWLQTVQEYVEWGEPVTGLIEPVPDVNEYGRPA